MRNAPSPIRTNTAPFNPVEQYAREFRAIPAPEEQGLVTQLELLAQAGVDLAERAAEPVTVWDLARLGVKLAAWIARKLR